MRTVYTRQTWGAPGCLTVDLESGRYAWVSQGFGDRGMVHDFTVDEAAADSYR